MKSQWGNKVVKKLMFVAVLICVIILSGMDVKAATNPYAKTYYASDGTLCYNCTWYAWQRTYDVTGVTLPGFSGNAKGWYQGAKNAGYTVSNVPRKNSVAVWTDNECGHVAFVESVSGENVTVSEAGTNYGKSSYACNTYTSAVMQTRWGQTLLGYIYVGNDESSSAITSGDSLGADFYAYIVTGDKWKHLTINNNNVQISDRNNSIDPKQIWHFINTSSSNQYIIKNEYNGDVLEVTGAGTADYTNIGVYTENGGNHQKWYIKSAGDGTYNLIPVHATNSRMDVPYGQFVNGVNIQLHQNNNSLAQKFYIYNTTRDNVSYSVPVPAAPKNVNYTIQGNDVYVTWTGSPQVNYVDTDRKYEVWLHDSNNKKVYYYLTDKTNHTIKNLPNGKYQLSIAAIAANYDTNKVGAYSYSSRIPLNKVPIISNVKIKNVSKTGYDIECKISCTSSISKVIFPTWTEKNGQDDLIGRNKWAQYEANYGTYSNGIAKFRVNTAAHNRETGMYYTHIYAYDSSGQSNHITCAIYVGDGNEYGLSPKYTMTYNGHRYLFFEKVPEWTNWTDAATYCQSIGGALVTISSQSENEKVHEYVKKLSANCWIGLNDICTEGTYEWDNGEKLSYTNYNQQPDNYNGNQDVFRMIHTKGTWDDVEIGSNLGFVCEINPHPQHIWGKGVVTKRPTCTATGIKTYTCSVCSDIKTEIIQAIGHKFSDNNTTTHKATFSKNGAVYTICKTCGTKKKTDTIKKLAPISLSKTTLIYNGKVRKPKVIVKDVTGKVLSNKSDYSLIYSDSASSKVGKYEVTVQFKGKYSGSQSCKYYIKKAQKIKVTPVQKNIKYKKIKGKPQSFVIKANGAKGKLTYKSNSQYVKVTNKGKVTIKKGTPKGKYKVTVKAKGNGKYDSGSKVCTINIL